MSEQRNPSAQAKAEHEAWLHQMQAESRVKQARFMEGIAARLKRPRQTEPPMQPFRGAPAFWHKFEWSAEQCIEEFTANFTSVGGRVVRLPDLKKAADWIAHKARELGAAYIVRQNEPDLDALQLEAALPEVRLSVWNTDPAEDWKARAAEADIGIVMADEAAAYTGSVAVLSSPQKGRSVSLLPTVLIILLPVERLRTRLGEILSRFDVAGREQLPAGIHFITGPSRSSDIENDLTIGVHGPGIVYTLLVG
ncbi:LutC/YkgG family protein [Paenibacillus polymyxa]|uniref:LutC/YkgG family protein n=1 Tax=Paenibacillus polymyxa TaxID=1406 RepID=UPI0025B63228|nr:lactate utilization protein [Paenibacillus polymyxa]MDN4085758.1 lactate utilization protein [Paenibacillus polymyxa]MDN4111667.1 lactate utilization protein [Paenibacillus polymyxa]